MLFFYCSNKNVTTYFEVRVEEQFFQGCMLSPAETLQILDAVSE
jgi:hypothetical protein